MVTRKTRRIVAQAGMWGLALVLSVGLVYLGLATWRVYTRMAEVRTMRVEAETERDTLKSRNVELGASLKALETERGVEAEIRSRYPLVKPGEVEFVLPPEEQKEAPVEQNKGFWEGLVARVGL